MDPITLARWDFAGTAIFHFFLVPLSLGLAVALALLQTAWVRTGEDKYQQAARFWFRPFLILYIVGVATGVVQEYQLHLEWKGFTEVLNDAFGGLLLYAGIVAFLLEVTLISLWHFGDGVFSRRVHVAVGWLLVLVLHLAATVTLTLNAWIQDPVGYQIDAQGHIAITDVSAVILSPTALTALGHTFSASLLTGGLFLVCVSSWRLRSIRSHSVFTASRRLGLWLTVAAAFMVMVSGDISGKVVTDRQPMKMAAAEALWETGEPAPFALFAVPDETAGNNRFAVEVPGALSFLATGNPDGEVRGITPLQREYAARYGSGDYVPPVAALFWSFRIMVGCGMFALAFAVLGLWLTRRGRWRGDRPPLLRRIWHLSSYAMVVVPFVGSATGWLLTETGREPWVVTGMLHMTDAVSPQWQGGRAAWWTIGLAVGYLVIAGYTLLKLVQAVRQPADVVFSPGAAATTSRPTGLPATAPATARAHAGRPDADAALPTGTLSGANRGR
jgi:cytochrome d ubiquinol oxidase subunit I